MNKNKLDPKIKITSNNNDLDLNIENFSIIFKNNVEDDSIKSRVYTIKENKNKNKSLF